MIEVTDMWQGIHLNLTVLNDNEFGLHNNEWKGFRLMFVAYNKI